MDLEFGINIPKLIRLVKKYPRLLDPQEPGFNSRRVNKKIWRKIDEEMGVLNPTCKKIWNSLKTRRLAFRAFQQRLRLADKSGTGSCVSWQWEEEMSFLDKYDTDTCCTLTASSLTMRSNRQRYYSTKEIPNEQEYLNECTLDVDEFLECIKNYPILTEIFKDRISESIIWAIVANKMGCSVKCCQAWWNKLTTRYNRELWLHENGMSSDWEHFHKMDFAKIYVSFNLGNISLLRNQSGAILRYFNKLGKFLEKAPKEKRAELDNQILNLILEAELNSYSSVSKQDLQEDTIEVLSSSSSSEDITTPSILDNVQPTNKYIVKIVPDGEDSLENDPEEYEINFLPDDLNIDAPLIECEAEEPGEIREECQNVEIKEELEVVEIKEELEVVEIKEELEVVEIKEELDVEIKEEVENLEAKNVDVEIQEEVDSMEIKRDEYVEIQEVEYVETQKEDENSEIQEDEVETIEIKEEAEAADILKILEEEDEEMVGCYVMEVTDE